MNPRSQNTHVHTLLQTSTTGNMSFLSGFLGNKAADSFVDQAVDKAASAAKRKVKEKLTGKKQPETDKTGGMGGLFPSSEEKDKKPKEKSGGLFGGLLKAEGPGANSGEDAYSAGGSNVPDNSGADSSFNDALDDLANEFCEK